MSDYLDKFLPKEARGAPVAPKSDYLDRFLPKEARAPQAATRTPDGRTVAPGTTEKMAADIPEGMVFDPKTGGYVDTALMAKRMGGAQGANASFLSGVPFVGEYMDEAIGKFDAAMTGDSPEIGQEIFRQSRKQFAEANPKAAAGLQLAGGIIGSLPAASAGIGLVAKAGGMIQKTVLGAVLGGGAGAVEGAASGYGSGTTPEDRRQRAETGAMIGGTLGAALGGIAPVFGRTVKEAARRIKKLDVATISDALGIDRKAASVVKGHLANDDLGQAMAALGRLGDDAMLADAGLGTGQLLDTVTQTGGKALKIGKEAVEGRATQIGGQLPDRLDDILGATVKGVKTSARDIASSTRSARQEAYDLAFSQAIDYADDTGRRIEGVLRRVPNSVLQPAISEANDAMQTAGKRNLQILADIAEDGTVVFKEMPNVEQLNQLKIALDTVAEQNVDQFGRKTAAGVRAARLAKDLKAAISDAVPEYSRAVRIGGDKIAQDKALAIGKDLLSTKIKIDDVREVMKGAATETRLAAKQGLRDGIEETLANVKRTITDPNVDAREAMTLVKNMSSRANRAKLVMVLGQDGADKMLDELDRQAAALELRAVIATNSKTAIRQSGKEAFEAADAPGIWDTAKKSPKAAASLVYRTLTGATDEADMARRSERLAQIADALTRVKGQDAQDALAIVQRAMSGQPIKDEEARAISRLVVSPLLLGAYQSGTQTQK